MLPVTVAAALALLPVLVAAGLFPAESKVQMVSAKDWKATLRNDQAAVVAFVAPWCGHCQKLVPDMTKVANGLYPLVPFYAVDCDAEDNKQLCAQQGVKGFPTIKMFPRGLKVPPKDFEKERTAANIFSFATKGIPAKIARVKKPEGISKWKFENRGEARAILLNKSKKIPLLWKVLANKYHDKVVFANVRDRNGRVSKALGFEPGSPKESKVIVFGANQRDAIHFQGVLRFDQLSEFIDQVVAGEVDVSKHIVGDEQIVLRAEKEDDSAGSKPIGTEGEVAEDDGETPEKDEL